MTTTATDCNRSAASIQIGTSSFTRFFSILEFATTIDKSKYLCLGSFRSERPTVPTCLNWVDGVSVNQ